MATLHPRLALRRHGPLLIGLLALFALQLWQASTQPLWMDESFTLTFARLPLAELLRRLLTNEPHLPPYFLFLRLWEQVAGAPPVAERLPSIACSLLIGALLWQVGRTLAGMPAAWLAFALWCIQPEGFWYAQEVRMYALLMLWAAVATWLLVRALAGHAWWPVALALTAAVWTHYSGLLLAVAVGLAGATFAHSRRQAVAALLATGAALATLIPWLLLLRMVAPTAAPAGTAVEQAFAVLGGITLGFGGPALAMPVVAGAVVALVGSLALAPFSGQRALQLPAVLIAVPLLLALAPGPLHIFFNERYLSFLAPPVCILWATAIPYIWKQHGPVGFGLAAVVAGFCLAGLVMVTGPNFRRWYDYPEAAAYVRARQQPGEVLVNNSGTDPTVPYYYQQVDGGTLPVVLLPRYQHAGLGDTTIAVQQLGQRYRGVWLIGDANGDWDGDQVAQRALQATLIPDGRQQFRDVTVQFFVTPRGLATQHPLAPAPNFGGSIEITSYGIQAGTDDWDVGLTWRALGPVGKNYTVFVHLLDAGGRLVGQQDGPPDGGRRPTSGWQAGDVIYDRHRIPIAAGAALHVEVGLYDLQTGKRLPLATQGNAVVLP